MEKITFELTIPQINIILAALVKLPIEIALDTFEEVKKQAQQQVNKEQTNNDAV